MSSWTLSVTTNIIFLPPPPEDSSSPLRLGFHFLFLLLPLQCVLLLGSGHKPKADHHLPFLLQNVHFLVLLSVPTILNIMSLGHELVTITLRFGDISAPTISPPSLLPPPPGDMSKLLLLEIQNYTSFCFEYWWKWTQSINSIQESCFK